jgi:hypothetical protein
MIERGGTYLGVATDHMVESFRSGRSAGRASWGKVRNSAVSVSASPSGNIDVAFVITS